MNLLEFQQMLNRHCDDPSSPERSAYSIMRSLLCSSYSLEKAEKDLTGMISGQQRALAVMCRVLRELQRLSEEEPEKSMAISQFHGKLRKRCDTGPYQGTYLEIWSTFSSSASKDEAVTGVAGMIANQRRQLATMRQTLKALQRETWEES